MRSALDCTIPVADGYEGEPSPIPSHPIHWAQLYRLHSNVKQGRFTESALSLQASHSR